MQINVNDGDQWLTVERILSSLLDYQIEIDDEAGASWYEIVGIRHDGLSVWPLDNEAQRQGLAPVLIGPDRVMMATITIL